MNALRSERGSVVVGGLTKLLVLLAVVGVVAYDGIAIFSAQLSVAQHGQEAADKAGQVWREANKIQAAYDAAQAALDPTGEVIDPATFTIEPETDTVSFRLTGSAPTFLAHRIGLTRELTVIEVEVVTQSAAPRS